MSFRDESFEKKGDNLFEASIILSFQDGKDNKTLVGKSTMEEDIEITEFMNDWYDYERREMKEEAKEDALSVFFEEVYGYTDISDIAVDEFDRPRNDKTRQPRSDCLTIDLTTET